MEQQQADHWHEVKNLMPRLRSGVKLVRRKLRGRLYGLLIDSSANRFHRITEPLAAIIERMDGQCSVETLWSSGLDCLGKSNIAPVSQQELVGLLSQLHAKDLIQTNAIPDSEEVVSRYQRQKKQKRQQSVLNPLGIKIPLIYPDSWFTKIQIVGPLLFSKVSLFLWLVTVLPAAFLATQHWAVLTENLSDRVLSASNLLLMWFCYPVVKAIHEFAHGVAVKRWGGRVSEIGLMFLVFTPVPYVDATSSYFFSSKWSRAMVACAGVAAELFVGSITLYVWLSVEPGMVKAIAFNIVFIAGFSTLVVNGNPLMRYDGYFALCDLVEIPNLSQRSQQYWAWIVDKFLLGATNAPAPLGSHSERWWLIGYGAVAPIYRLFVTIGLIWFVSGKYFILGIALALLSVWSSLLKPIWNAILHLDSSQALSQIRKSSKRRAIAFVVTVLSVLTLLPLPFYSVQEAIVWVPDTAILRAEESGHVGNFQFANGDRVRVGEIMGHLFNPQLVAEYEIADAEVFSLNTRIRQTEQSDHVRTLLLNQELEAATAKRSTLQQRVESLKLQARVDGQWASASPFTMFGRYIQRGEIVGYVLNEPSNVLRVPVTQDNMVLIRNRIKEVEARTSRDFGVSIKGLISRDAMGGSNKIVSSALTTYGGGLIPDNPSDPDHLTTLDKTFDLEVVLQKPVEPAVFGDRAYVRFDLGSLPILWQWSLRLKQLFLARLGY